MLAFQVTRAVCLLSIALACDPLVFAQESTTCAAPFVVHKLTHASESSLLLIGQHGLAKLRLDPSQSPQIEASDPQLSIGDKSQILIADAATSDSNFVIGGSATNQAGITEAGAVAWLDSQAEVVWRTDLTASVVTLAVASPFVVVGDTRGTLTALAIEDGKVAWESQTHGKMVTAIATLNNEFGVSGDWSGKIVMWSRSDGREVANFQQHRDRITSLQSVAIALATDPPKLVSASRDGTLRLWHPTQRRLVRFVQLNQPIACCTHLRELQFVAATTDGNLHRIDLANATKKVPLPSDEAYISSAARLGESLFIASGESDQLRVIAVEQLLR